jgi:hypothetical protein
VERNQHGITILIEGRDSLQADRVVVATGFRPEWEGLREIRLSLDPVLECPLKLAPLIDPRFHACGSVPEHGVEELAHPEPDFFLVGMKSYGRAPTFLLRTGYAQVDAVVHHVCAGSPLIGPPPASLNNSAGFASNDCVVGGVPTSCRSQPDRAACP